MADFFVGGLVRVDDALAGRLVSWRDACCSSVSAASRLPESAAARNRRIDVFNADFTLLLRSRRLVYGCGLIWT